MKRPRTRNYGAIVTTPLSADIIALLGPDLSSGGVVLTRSESDAIRQLYGYKEEEVTERPPEPIPPKPPDPSAGPEDAKTYRQLKDKYDREMANWRKWEDPLPLMRAGAVRNAIRHAEADGLRLLAWIAKYVPPGGDPLKTLVQCVVDSGFDVSSQDFNWAETGEDGEQDGEVT